MAVTSGLVDRAVHPLDAGKVDTEIVLHQAADKDRRGLGVERHADALAGKVLRHIDEPAVDYDEAMPKHPRGEDRQRRKKEFFCRKTADIFGTRPFSGIAFT